MLSTYRVRREKVYEWTQIDKNTNTIIVQTESRLEAGQIVNY